MRMYAGYYSMEKINLSPNPISLIESMRDIGYSLETAIADVIDNSISAKSQFIEIRFDWNNSKPWLAIIDDGLGMNKSELISAMRIGSKNPLDRRDVDDLGRFGLGLKTASFSQCRCLTVLSKKNKIISCTKWDLDIIASEKSNQWSLCLLSPDEVICNCPGLSFVVDEYLLNRESGTIVLWEKLDKINDGTSNKNKESNLNASINSVRNHLELVFHRFLSPSPGEFKVAISINNNKLESFDPFNQVKSTELREEKFRFEGEVIKVQPYVLPYHNKVTKAEWKKYAGKNGYLLEQGFYVYRNRRLIIHANWFRMIRKEELTKLLRVKVDIPNTLDHLWKIDIKKSNAFPPLGVRDELKRIIGKIEFSGKKVYKQKGQMISENVKYPTWLRIAKDNQIFYQINKEHPVVEKYLADLSEREKGDFHDIISMLESTFPRETFFNDVATKPEQMKTDKLEKDQIKRLLELFLQDTKGPVNQTKLREITQIVPFASNKALTKDIIKELGYEL